MDRAASAGFEGIAQMLLEQKKLMDALESENRELRRQLADLRRGMGIAVVIEGKTIQLATDPGSPIPMKHADPGSFAEPAEFTEIHRPTTLMAKIVVAQLVDSSQ